jgi:predicted DNA-binding protein (UPF0251 family)
METNRDVRGFSLHKSLHNFCRTAPIWPDCAVSTPSQVSEKKKARSSSSILEIRCSIRLSYAPMTEQPQCSRRLGISSRSLKSDVQLRCCQFWCHLSHSVRLQYRIASVLLLGDVGGPSEHIGRSSGLSCGPSILERFGGRRLP